MFTLLLKKLTSPALCPILRASPTVLQVRGRGVGLDGFFVGKGKDGCGHLNLF